MFLFFTSIYGYAVINPWQQLISTFFNISIELFEKGETDIYNKLLSHYKNLLLLGKILLFHNDFAQSASGHGWGRCHTFVSLLYLIFDCGSHPSHLPRYQLIYPVYDPK